MTGCGKGIEMKPHCTMSAKTDVLQFIIKLVCCASIFHDLFLEEWRGEYYGEIIYECNHCEFMKFKPERAYTSTIK